MSPTNKQGLADVDAPTLNKQLCCPVFVAPLYSADNWSRGTAIDIMDGELHKARITTGVVSGRKPCPIIWVYFPGGNGGEDQDSLDSPDHDLPVSLKTGIELNIFTL